MVKFCDKCGAKLNGNVKFCDSCGNKVSNGNEDSSSVGVTYSCPYCGQTISFSTKCPYCGKSLKNNDAAKIGIGIIGIIILFILIFGIAGFLLILFMSAA